MDIAGLNEIVARTPTEPEANANKETLSCSAEQLNAAGRVGSARPDVVVHRATAWPLESSTTRAALVPRPPG